MTVKLSYNEAIDLVAGRKRPPAGELELHCQDVAHLPLQDAVDLYLSLRRTPRWCWVDSEGNRREGSRLLPAMTRVARDVLYWPAAYVRHRERTALIEYAGRECHPRLDGEPQALYLRTDHWFNLKSGGSVGHVKGVVEALRTLGALAAIVSSDALPGVLPDRLHVLPPDYRLGRNVPNLPELRYNTQLLRAVHQGAPAWRPNFIYQRYSLGNYVGPALRERHGWPYVCEYNGSFPWMSRKWQGRKLFHEELLTEIELLNLRAADLIVVVSRAMKDELIGRQIDGDKVLVNPNGVDADLYSPQVDGAQVREHHGLSSKVVIGFIGTFGPWHGAEVLADAFGRLLAAHPQYREQAALLMMGDGVKMDEVRQQLAWHSAQSHAVLTGMIPQAQGPAHLAACDVLASPHVPNPDGTPFFGSPTKLFEYMAMGRGIVASDLDQIGEVLHHERTALMVNPGDADDLADGLKRLIDDAALRVRLGAAARQEAVQQYTWEAHTRRILDALQERCA